MIAIAASTVLAAGSKPSGSPIRSTRETAALGTTAQPMPGSAQQTEILCSAEKPSVPKKSRSRRSSISPRQRIRCPRVYSVRVSALDASMCPWALMTVTGVWLSHGWERQRSARWIAGVRATMVIPDERLSPVCSAWA